MSRKPTRTRNLDRKIALWWENASCEGHERPPSSVVRELATETGYSTRQVKRRMQMVMGLLEPVRRWAPTETDVLAVYLWSGVLTRAYSEMGYREPCVNQETGVLTLGIGPSLSTFKRRIKALLGSVKLAHARHGSAKAREAQLYLKNPEPPHRNVKWEMDHTELRNWVVPKGSRTPVKPWLTVVIEVKHKVVLGWAISYGTPTQESVRAALMQAIHLRYENGIAVGGRPMIVMWDRGLEFLADLISDACNTLKFYGLATPPMTPNQKGSIEAWNKTIKTNFCPPLPGYTGGARDLRGRSSLETHALGEELYTAKLADWIDHYNHHRPHSALGGLTPIQSWAQDTHPLDIVEDEALWFGFLKGGNKVKISKNGARFRKRDYTAPELHGFTGRGLEVKYLPSDFSFIELFDNGTYVCTAFEHEAMTAEEREAFFEQRRNDRAESTQYVRKANLLRNSGFEGGEIHSQREIADEEPQPLENDDSYDLTTGGEEAYEALVKQAASAAQGALF